MRYTVFDVETPNYANNRMSAIGIVVMEDDQIRQRFYSLVNPECHFDGFNVALTGITPEMVADAPTFDQLWPQIRSYFDNAILMAHNAQFDMAVLAKCLQHYGITWKDTAQYICTCRMGKPCLPMLANHKLNTICDYYGIELEHHQADSDALACAEIFRRLSRMTDARPYLRRYDMHAIRTLPQQKGRCGGRYW
jgi:DNA polymerase-3 subunit epsilon